MDKVGNLFGNAAVCLTLMVRQGKEIISEKSWKSTIEGLGGKDCYVNKPCPKNTYLSMCSKGVVKNIPSGNYLMYETVELEYAKIAIKLLANDETYSENPMDLWKEVLKRGNYNEDKNYDYQMHVVCALWNAEMIKVDNAMAESIYVTSCNFILTGQEYVVGRTDKKRYEIINKETGVKPGNMKGVAQQYFKNIGIDEIKGNTYDVLKVLMAYLMQNK